MNNLTSYGGLVDAKIRASDKDLPVAKVKKFCVTAGSKREKLGQSHMLFQQRFHNCYQFCSFQIETLQIVKSKFREERNL